MVWPNTCKFHKLLTKICQSYYILEIFKKVCTYKSISNYHLIYNTMVVLFQLHLLRKHINVWNFPQVLRSEVV